MQFKSMLSKRKRQKATVLFAVFIGYVLLLSGIFSYFHSEDAVTNRIEAKAGSVIIKEPKWDGKGINMAQRSEPGMQIPKDPSGYNDGQVDLYVRLKMTVELGKYSGNLIGSDTDDGDVGVPTDAKRLDAIVKAIKNDNGEQFLNLNTTSGAVSEWKIASWDNPAFIAEAENYSAVDDESNKDKKLVFYFYYTGGDTDSNGSSIMRIVKPEESTATLFDHLDIPIYKKDYLGVFDQQYRISLQAEGIPVREENTPMTAAEASAKFAEEKN